MDEPTIHALPAPYRLLRACGLSRGRVRRAMLARLKASGRSRFSTRFFGRDVVVDLDNATDQKVLLSSRPYNETEIRFLASHVTEGGWFVDLGTNSGLIGAGVLACNPAIRVIAIEPNPRMMERARYNLRTGDDPASKDVIFVEVAIVDHEGSIFLDLKDGYGQAFTRSEATGTSIEVPCKPFDRILTEQGIDRIDAMKIDIEGAEETVVPAFVRSLDPARLPVALVMERPTPGDGEALAALADAGYRMVGETKGNLLFLRNRLTDAGHMGD